MGFLDGSHTKHKCFELKTNLSLCLSRSLPLCLAFFILLVCFPSLSPSCSFFVFSLSLIFSVSPSLTPYVACSRAALKKQQSCSFTRILKQVPYVPRRTGTKTSLQTFTEGRVCITYHDKYLLYAILTCAKSFCWEMMLNYLFGLSMI